MTYYLDTNTCVYYLKGINDGIVKTLLSHHPDEIKIPAVVKAELLYGVEKSKRKEENIEKVIKFLFPFEIVSFDDEATYEYSQLRAELEAKGEIIGPNDLLIASTVLAKKGILVTNNEREFRRVPNLKIENWFK